MTEYPEKTCEIDRLVRQPKLVAAVLEGRKSQQRRDGVYGYPGETFELEGISFQITELYRQSWGDMADADAQAEGYPSLNMYKDLITKMHPGMSWDDDHLVWVHQFDRVAT
ncbi:MAG: ASCH domain-containing protein [Gammaproteobacteria bacterium]|nr:MAG: ASCH domain-containing protein [Gammaproteobacteria bacterium]